MRSKLLKGLLFIKFLMLLSFGFLLSSCSITSQGNFVRLERSDYGGEVIGYSYDFEISNLPTKYSPFLGLYLNQYPRNKVAYVEKYTEVQKPNKALGGLMMIGGVGAMIGAKNSENDKQKDNLTSGGGIAILLGLAVIANNTETTTGRLIDGETKYQNETGIPSRISNSSVRVKSGWITKDYSSGRNGIITIPVSEFLSYKKTYNPLLVNLEVESKSTGTRKVLSLDPKNWLVPKAEIIANYIWVFESASANSRRLFKLQKAENVIIESDTETNWYKIKIYNGSGFIPSLSVKRFWSKDIND